MGETAKILTPHKRVLMPTLEATCSLDLGCPIEEFAAFCDQHPQRKVVVYANTSAAVKARADWVVTSANPIYAPIDADSPAVSGLIFCVQKASTVRVVLPQSGALGGAGLLAATAVLGTTTLATGLFLQLRRRNDGL